MNDQQQLTCIMCPIGCPLQLTHDGLDILEIEGNQCTRGAKYAAQEFKDPRRYLSTTVAIEGARHRRLPVKITAPVQKDRVIEAARAIHTLTVTAPIKLGTVLMKDLLGEPGVDVVATRSMERIAS